MNIRDFSKISLFLPIVVSLIATARPWFACIASTDPYCLNKTISDYELFVGLYPILFGGIPYLIFLTASLVWLSRKPQFSAIVFFICAPLVYTCIQIILVGGYYMFLVNINEALIHSLFLGIYAIVYGYVYVIVIGIIWFLFKSAGISSNKSLNQIGAKNAPPG